MFCNCNANKFLHIYILLIITFMAHGNGNFFNVRNRNYDAQRNTDRENNKLKIKGDVNNPLVEDRAASAVGEVFVPKTFPLSSQEPSCEQLRAMWIFSKRQSRAAEITNEIPTYRDPFTYNVWEPLYSNARVLGSIRMGGRERARSPVFGRVINREPTIPLRPSLEQRQRLVDGNVGGATNSVSSTSTQARLFGAESRPVSAGSSSSSPRRTSKNRYMGVPTSSVANMPGNLNSVAVQGSFQKLKELIWTERAKELTQQRRAEELAARAAVLKEIANGQNIQASYKPAFSMHSDSILMDENRTPDRNAIHDERMSIVSDQRFGSNHNKNGHRNIVSTAATIRRIGNSYATGTAFSHKDSGTGAGSIFSLNVNPSNQKTNSRLKIPATELRVDNLSENNQAVIGIPRTYPIRQSYFRERNRSLLKQNSPNDYFQRSIRKLKYQQPVEIEDIMLRDITPGDDIEIITSPLYMDYNNNDPRVTGIRPFPLSTLNTDIYEYNDY